MQSQSGCLAPHTIVMLGTAPGMMGGVSSVIDIYAAQGFLAHWNISYIVTHTDGSALRKLNVALQAIVKFLSIFSFYRPRILHVHVSPYISFWRKFSFIKIAQARGCRVILHLHGDNFDAFHDSSHAFLRPAIQKLIANCALIIVLSEEWRSIDFFHTIAAHVPVTCIANPVVIPAPQAGAVKSGKHFLFLGKFAAAKGVFDLIRAFAIVVKQEPQATLQLGGNGDIEPARRLIAELGLGGRVELLGWVQGAQKQNLLSNAIAYVLPSYNEGLPMGVLEAMAYELPVIATPVGGIPGAVRDNIEGMLVPVGDVEQLAKALLRVVSAPDEAARLGKAGRLRAETMYSAPVIIAKLGTIYQEFLQAPHR